MFELLRDNITGHAQSIGSASVQPFPKLNRKIGGSDLPNFYQIRWRKYNQRHNIIEDWQHYDKDQAVKSALPANWQRGTFLTVDKSRYEIIKQSHIKNNPEQAVAYRLGHAIMIGSQLQGKDFFVADEEDESRFGIGMRIGNGSADLAIGAILHYGRTRAFLDLSDENTAGKIENLKDLERFV